jgi:hypothetical protein
LDSSLNIIGDGLLPEGGKVPDGLDWSDINVGSFVNSIRNSNPLTQSFGKTAISNGVQGWATDQSKNFIKGDGAIFDSWKQDCTGQFIDNVSDAEGKAFTPLVEKGLSNIYQTGKAVKNTADNMNSFLQRFDTPVRYMY